MVDTLASPSPPLTRRRLLASAANLAGIAGAPAAIGRAAAAPAEIHVSLDGHDTDALAAAVVTARSHRLAHPDRTIVIDLPERLTVDRTLTLGPPDSGRPTAPLVFRGAAPRGTTMTGGHDIVPLPADAASPAILARVPAAVRGAVRVYALGPLGAAISPAYAAFNSPSGRPSGRLFVFEGERRLTPARWPAKGYLTRPTFPGDPQGQGQGQTLTVALASAPAGFAAETDMWVDGFWGHNWWIERSRVTPSSATEFSIDRPHAPVKPSARFAFINVASGLDGPGKVYVDEAAGHLYLIPSGDRTPTVPIVDTLLRIAGAQDIRFEGIAFEQTIGTAVAVTASDRIAFSAGWFGHSGTHGLTIEGGWDNQVQRCIVADTGYGGIAMGGGNLATLQPAGHRVEGCRIHHFGVVLPTYQPGIRVSGVGVTVAGNEIAHGDHAGILFTGNDHRILGNVLHDLVRDTEDAGAIYSGRNWATRGTVIARNFFHDVTNRVSPTRFNVHGVYLDDELSGITVIDNVFIDVDQPILVGGGRDNLIGGNLGLRGRYDAMILVDARGLTWQKAMVAPQGTLWRSVQRDPAAAALYAERYPGFSTTLTDRPGAPIDNRFIGNLSDKAPVIRYQPPAVRDLGEEIGTRVVDARASAFPSAAGCLPGADPAYAQLAQTRRMIMETLAAVAPLSFSGKAPL